MNTQLAVAELERLAADAAQPEDIRQASSVGAARVHDATHTSSDAELEQLAREALERAQTLKKVPNGRSGSTSDGRLPVRSFVFLRNDLREWWLRYDCAEIASSITDEQLEQLETTLAGTVEFVERLRSLCAESGGMARVSQSCAPFV